jgi:DNA-binding Xre family transcriptional regulator
VADEQLPVLAWRLPVLMAERGIRTTRALRIRLAAHGVILSEPQLGRVVKKLPKQLNTQLLTGLCAALHVSPGELLVIPGFRSASTAKDRDPGYSSTSPADVDAPKPGNSVPKVLPRSASGRPQATALPRPKY